jgi:anti-sigma regulatory factor (Ser/Thr protein kinase)/PAS domain-containing protein
MKYIIPLKITLLLLLSGHVFALETGNAENHPLDGSSERLFIANGMGTLEDREGSLTLNDVSSGASSAKFSRPAKEIPNFGFTKSVFWTRFTLENRGDHDISRLMEIGFPLLDRIEVYSMKSFNEGLVLDKAYRSQGRNFPFSQRIIAHRNFIYPITVPAGGKRIFFIRIRTDDGMIIPVTLWSEDAFQDFARDEQFILGIYYGIVIVMILYNLFLFVSVRDRNYLYYIMYVACFGLFQMAMNGLAFQYLWPGAPWWGIRANPFLIGASITMAVNFSIRFLDTSANAPVMDKMFRILKGLSILLMICSLFIDYSISIMAGQLLPLVCIILVIPTAGMILYRGFRPARFYIIAWSAFLAGIVLSTLRVMGILPHNILTEHGLQMGSALEMVLLSLALADRISTIKKEKEDAQQQIVENLNRSNSEIREAHRKVTISEEKYRILVEGSGEIIFTMDENWNLLTASKSIKKELHINPEDVPSVRFPDLIYGGRENNNLGRKTVMDKLEELSKLKKPVNFTAQFRSPINSEPREMDVRLEYLNLEGKNEILGRVSSIIDDSLLHYFDSEKQKYVIGNYLTTAEDISHRITRNLKKYIPDREINVLRIALLEVLINAIEHGNLRISFEEKSEAIMREEYFDLIARRQNDPDNSEKGVSITYSVDPERVVYIISDEGEGFDHGDYMEKAVKKANSDMLPHGRGIAMTTNCFDHVKYNSKGNQVMLIKYFNRQNADPA